MIYELKTFKVICDICGHSEIVTANQEYNAKPQGWDTLLAHGWATGHREKNIDRCPKCVQTDERPD